MNASISRRLFAATLLAAGACGTAGAAPRAVEAFDKQAWQALQAQAGKPLAVVFSATWCANCPEVIDRLSADIRARKLDAQLVAVVMDVAPGEQDGKLLRDAHYRRTDRLFAFSGQAPALRYTVDPRWRGVTPYVVLLSPNAAPVALAGQPSDEQLRAWAGRAR